MSIPKILALEVNYDLNKEELEKTVKLNLNIDKSKFEAMNKLRIDNKQDVISLDQVQKIIYQGKVEYKENNFNFVIDKDDEITKTIHSLLKIDISYFNTNNKYFLHLSPELSNLMEVKNYQEISNKYYREIKENIMKNEVGLDNYEKIKSGEHKFSILFKTLLNEPLKQIDNLFLPTISNNTDNNFIFEKDNNNETFKYLMYIPDNYIWDIPVDMNGNIVKLNNVNYKFRYLTIEEINDNSFISLLEDNTYLENLGKIVTEKKVDLTVEKPFEENWSTEEIKELNANVEINILPKLVKDENGEVILTPPGSVKEQLLKLFFGINNKFFEQKIFIKNSISESLS